MRCLLNHVLRLGIVAVVAISVVPRAAQGTQRSGDGSCASVLRVTGPHTEVQSLLAQLDRRLGFKGKTSIIGLIRNGQIVYLAVVTSTDLRRFVVRFRSSQRSKTEERQRIHREVMNLLFAKKLNHRELHVESQTETPITHQNWWSVWANIERSFRKPSRFLAKLSLAYGLVSGALSFLYDMPDYFLARQIAQDTGEAAVEQLTLLDAVASGLYSALPGVTGAGGFLFASSRLTWLARRDEDIQIARAVASRIRRLSWTPANEPPHLVDLTVDATDTPLKPPLSAILVVAGSHSHRRFSTLLKRLLEEESNRL